MHLITIYEFDPFRDLSHWFYLFGLLVGTARVIIFRLRTRMGQAWPVVNGTVESATVPDASKHIDIVYSYSVAGEYYSGHFFTDSMNEKKREALLAQYPTGARLLVHYKPDSPEISVIDLHETRTKSQLSGCPTLNEKGTNC